MDLKLKQTDFELSVSLTTKAFFITPAIFQPWVKLFIMAALIFYRAIVCDNKNALNSTFTNSKQQTEITYTQKDIDQNLKDLPIRC